MKRVLLQPACVLHVRSFRETSQLVEILTPDHGRLSLVARGVRRPRSLLPGLLQPFVPLLVSFGGRSELMTLMQAEARACACHLRGNNLFAGLYLNELMMYLLQKGDAQPQLFLAYEQTIAALATAPSGQLDAAILRQFEQILLVELGYGVLPNTEAELQKAFAPDKFYRFVTEQGFVACDPHDSHPEALRMTAIFAGSNLLAMARQAWDAESLMDARRLTRLVLSPLLGDKQIVSRQFFV